MNTDDIEMDLPSQLPMCLMITMETLILFYYSYLLYLEFISNLKVLFFLLFYFYVATINYGTI